MQHCLGSLRDNFAEQHIQKPQNRIARVLTYSNYDADVRHLFELLGWKNRSFPAADTESHNGV